jgi:hypothetical protein
MEVLKAVLRKVTIMRVDKEGEDSTEVFYEKEIKSPIFQTEKGGAQAKGSWRFDGRPHAGDQAECAKRPSNGVFGRMILG